MDSISRFLVMEHDRCDALFYQAESEVSKGGWTHAASTFREFSDTFDNHLTSEEEVLFPALEESLGSADGPTSVMRKEHQQMRQIVTQLSAAIDARDAAEFLGCSDTLNILVQQHNMKEENILYVMADRLLANRKGEIIVALGRIFA